ncbi:MAG: ATP-grasp domain-containing protein [Bdellovibrionales bacterium]|nr:ATP-grasp domain-containing protein [Bdellovibrionales bacterium]
MGRIWVLEAYRQSLSIARALVEVGEEPVLGYTTGREGEDYTAACLASRSFRSSIALPGPADPEAFVAAVERVLKNDSSIDAVIPVGETSLLAFHSVEARLRRLRPWAATSAEVAAICLNKESAGATAAQLGFDVPRSYSVSGAGELDLALRAVGYPCVVKPPDSTVRIGGLKALRLSGDSERRRLLPGWPEGAKRLLVQEFARGHRHNCMFVARKGKLVARFESRVIRADEPWGFGYGVESVSVAPDPGHWRAVEALAEKLEYDGPGCAQFLVEGGRFRFLELNPRFDASVVLACRCGVNLPAIAVASALGEGAARIALVGRSGSYPRGRRLHWLLGDLSGALRALRSRSVGPLGFVIWMSRCWLAAWRASVHMTWDFRDRAPSRVLLRRFFSSVKRALL